jgi:hypothetical protein
MLIFHFRTRQHPPKTYPAIPAHTSPPTQPATPLIGPAAAALPLVTIAPIHSTPAPTNPITPTDTNTHRTK